MAIFIPEWQRTSGRNIHLKRIFNALGDDHVIRQPLNTSIWSPDFFVHHPAQGWLALTVCDSPFSELDPMQLFDAVGRDTFEQLLAGFQKLEGIPDRLSNKLAKLVVMWSCTPEQCRALTSTYLTRFGVRLLSKEQFKKIGATLMTRMLEPVSAEDSETLLGHYFPEAEIPAICTTRRDFQRDNSAKLTRFFLDTQQEWASKLDMALPDEQDEAAKDFSVRLINGVAGSGKTLIALNRARLLAQMYPEQQILVLIHNTPIVADIKERLHRAYGGIPENLEITTFAAWANNQWQRLFKRWPRMPYKPTHVPELIRHYREKWPDLKLLEAQLIDEIDYINASLIADEATYLEINRIGQGFALRAKERSDVWAIYEAVVTALARDNLRLWSAIPRDICLTTEQGKLHKYHHILVDEAQFFAPSWFQVVKLSMEPVGQLFLCADPNQGFMNSRLSWKSVGLDVAGRTKKLRKSYRTTKALLQAASHILENATHGDPEDYLEPDYNNMEEGDKPILVYTDSPQDSVDRLCNEIAKITKSSSLPLSSILIIYGDEINKPMLVSEIGKRIGSDKVWWLNKKEHKKEPPHGYGQDYLRIAYLDTATGLEGGLVFLIGMEGLMNDNHATEKNEDEKTLQREQNARKRYMALTRAGRHLVLLASESLPEYISVSFVQSTGGDVSDLHTKIIETQ